MGVSPLLLSAECVSEASPLLLRPRCETPLNFNHDMLTGYIITPMAQLRGGGAPHMTPVPLPHMKFVEAPKGKQAFWGAPAPPEILAPPLETP